MPTRLLIRITRLNFDLFFQSVIETFCLNIFSRVNVLLTKLARDLNRRKAALGLFWTHWQDLWPIFPRYSLRAWLIRYIYWTEINWYLYRFWKFLYGVHHISTQGLFINDSLRASSLVWTGSRDRELVRRMGQGKVTFSRFAGSWYPNKWACSRAT